MFLSIPKQTSHQFLYKPSLSDLVIELKRPSKQHGEIYITVCIQCGVVY